MTDKGLICTRCNEPVNLGVGYDGYFGECSCSKMYIQPHADRHNHWEQVEEVKSPSNFGVDSNPYREDTTPEVTCAVCKQSDSTSVEFTEVDVFDFSVRADFKCSNDHWHNDRDNESVAYYSPERNWSYIGFIPDEYVPESVREAAGLA